MAKFGLKTNSDLIMFAIREKIDPRCATKLEGGKEGPPGTKINLQRLVATRSGWQLDHFEGKRFKNPLFVLQMN